MTTLLEKSGSHLGRGRGGGGLGAGEGVVTWGLFWYICAARHFNTHPIHIHGL